MDSSVFDVKRGNARLSADALTFDTQRAVKGLGLDDTVIAHVLGTDSRAAADVLSGATRLEPASVVGRRAFLLVRLYRALGDVFGSLERVQQWLRSEEPALGGAPVELIQGDQLPSVVRHMERQCRDSRWVW